MGYPKFRKYVEKYHALHFNEDIGNIKEKYEFMRE